MDTRTADRSACPTGWPRHTTAPAAQADARGRNASNTLRRARWKAWACPDCQGSHVTPFALATLRRRNPRQRARLLARDAAKLVSA